MNQAIFLLRIAVIIFVVAIVFRVMGHHNANPIELFGKSITPAALNRVVDTLLLGTIALALVHIHRVLQIGRDGSDSAQVENKKDQSSQASS